MKKKINKPACHRYSHNRAGRIFVAVVLILTIQQSFSQQMGLYTNYLLNDFYYNPAIAGTRDVYVANLNYRNQWSGFNEAPKTYMASVYGSWKNKRKIGLGASITGDRAGLTSKTGVYLTYAYHFNLTEKLRLSFGAQAGYQQYRLRLYDARVVDGGDDMLTGNVTSLTALDMNAGVYLYHSKFFLGASGFQLLNNRFKSNTTSNLYAGNNTNSALTAHYYLMGGVNIKINKKNTLQPSVLMRQNGPVPYQLDISARWLYDNKFWVGATYRTSDAYCVIAGFNFKDLFNVGYSYDMPFTNMKRYSMGSHEIWLSWTINKKKKTLDEEDEEINNGVHDLFKQKKQAEDEKKK